MIQEEQNIDCLSSTSKHCNPEIEYNSKTCEPITEENVKASTAVAIETENTSKALSSYTNNFFSTPNSKDNIKVVVRIRPRTIKEQESRSAIRQEDSSSLTVLSTGKTFKYDYIADENISQKDIFNITTTDIAESALNGYNGTVFVYGQTGAGKTYTLLGKNPDLKIGDYSGLLPRTVDYLFAKIKSPEYKTHMFTIKCSFLEIYNENIFDLLSNASLEGGLLGTSTASAGSAQSIQAQSPNRQLFIRDQGDSVKVENLTEHLIRNTEEALELINQGLKNRATAPTAANKESSRSHAVFSIHIENKMKVNNKKITKRSVFHLIDLAGSERQKNTETTGDRIKEAGKINKSLMNLGHVIKTLTENAEKKKSHIHYRDSKLTHLLKDSLGGNSKTCIVANISSAYAASSETVSTLSFALCAKLIKNKAVVNEEISNENFYKEELKRILEQFDSMKMENKLLLSLVKENGVSNKNMGLLNSAVGNGNLNLNINLGNISGYNTNNNNVSNQDIKNQLNTMNINPLSTLEGLEKQLSVLEEEGAVKESKINELVKENTFLNQRLERLDIDYKLIKMEKREEEEKLNGLNFDLSKCKEALSNYTKYDFENKRIIDELTFDLKTKEQQLQNEALLSTERINDLSKRLSFKEEECNQVKQEIILQESTVKYKEEKIKQIEQEIMKKDIQINDLELNIKTKEIEVVELNSKNEELLHTISLSKSELRAKASELSQYMLEKQEEISNLSIKKQALSLQNEVLLKELKKYKLIIRSHNNSINEITESKDNLEKKFQESNTQLLESVRANEMLVTEVSIHRSKIRTLEETLDSVNKDYALILENKNNASKMNSILNQRREISELQKELQSKNGKITSMEGFLKNLNLNNKGTSKVTSSEIIEDIEKKNQEINKSRSIMHDCVFQIKNNLDTNKDGFNICSLAKDEVESKTLEEKFRFFLDQYLQYVKHLEKKIDFKCLEMLEQQKKVDELKGQISKHSEIFKDNYLPYERYNLSQSGDKGNSNLTYSNSNNNSKDFMSENNLNTLNLNNEEDKTYVTNDQGRSPSLNVDYEKISSELIETFVNNPKNKSSILQKMSEADLIDKKTFYSTYQTIGKKRSSKLKNDFSLITEEKDEEGTEKKSNNDGSSCFTSSSNFLGSVSKEILKRSALKEPEIKYDPISKKKKLYHSQGVSVKVDHSLARVHTPVNPFNSAKSK